MSMTIVTVGIDLAKNVFAVHGVNQAGKPELIRPDVRRAKLLELVVSLPPCLIGMEAYAGAHHWARQFQQLDHTVRLIAPHLVAPYRMGGKHGKNDAAAICEAVTRPNMRFVPIKSLEQQGKLFVHRVHQGYVTHRTELIHRIRGLLSKLGIVLPKAFKQGVYQVLEDLPGYCNLVIGELLSELAHIEERVACSQRQIQQMARHDPQAQLLMQRAGIGPNTASAYSATLGNGHEFKNGRQVSACAGRCWPCKTNSRSLPEQALSHRQETTTAA